MIVILFSIFVTSIHSEIANIGKDKQKKSKSNTNYFILNNPKLEKHNFTFVIMYISWHKILRTGRHVVVKDTQAHDEM